MRATYDAKRNTAYVYIVDEPLGAEEVVAQQTISDEVILDFDKRGKLLGIEILNARNVLRKSVLLRAEKLIGSEEYVEPSSA